MSNGEEIILIGYSGHSFVVAETLSLLGYSVLGYLDKRESERNPISIKYFGYEQDSFVLESIRRYSVFPAIGDNMTRKKTMTFFSKKRFKIPSVIHPSANVTTLINIGKGTLICRGVCINPFVTIGDGVIINTGAIVEHECKIGNYSHIAPGVVLAGNVNIGEGSFIGANSVLKQNVTIGNNIIIGAGSVVIKNIVEEGVYAGNPAKKIK